jgi:Protein of unknown function (DUF2442)
MQPSKAASPDRASEVVPEVRHTVPWRVVSVEALDGSRLRVQFVDGTVGEVWMQEFLANPTVIGTVFEPLRDPAEFARVRIELGAVSWSCGADLAPDAMYEAIRAHGAWVLE